MDALAKRCKCYRNYFSKENDIFKNLEHNPSISLSTLKLKGKWLKCIYENNYPRIIKGMEEKVFSFTE
jgi:uncharacterized pyridoxamine 5'-phosphate oxidase family protein